MILPVTMLSASWVAWYTRFLRASMLEVIHQDFVRTAAGAKAIREPAVATAATPFATPLVRPVTPTALDLPYIFSGALFTEVIFAWPGMDDSSTRRPTISTTRC